MIAPFTYKMSQQTMLYLCIGRLILVPFLAMCALHGARTSLFDDIWAMFLSLVLGVSNGVLGSVPMIVAPSKVPHQFRELTGKIRTNGKPIAVSHLRSCEFSEGRTASQRWSKDS